MTSEKGETTKDSCPICGETDPDKHEAENLDCEIANHLLSDKNTDNTKQESQ